MRLTFRAVLFILFTLIFTTATMAQEQQSPQRIRVGGQVQAAMIVKQVPPEYPALARQARIQGIVRLQVIISKEGLVKQIEVLSGHPLMVQPALEAVRQWEYRPTLLNGELVEVVTTVEVVFTLPETAAKEVPPPSPGNPPSEVKQLRVGSDGPRPVKEVRPEYPQLAKQARIQGTVRLQVVVSKEGEVKQVETSSGHPLLVQAAMDAVKQWQFQPTLLNGKPIEVVTNIAIVFDLPGPADSASVKIGVAEPSDPHGRNERSAIGSLRVLNTANFSYSATFNSGFAPALANLGPGNPPSAAAADLIDPVLVSGSKDGYNFIYTAGAPDADGRITSYTISAEPITPGTTGQRYFFTNQTGVIRFIPFGPANASSPPIS